MSLPFRSAIKNFLVLGVLSSWVSLVVASAKPELILSQDQIQVSLPEAEAESTYRWLEGSVDLKHWVPLARDYGKAWENLFPYALPLFEPSGDKMLQDASESDFRYFRLATVEEPSSVLTNLELVSRFLQQATFGPTRDLIYSFPGVDTVSGFNDEPYVNFETWIDAQIQLPLTSLRAFWRERSNPDFTEADPSSSFPDSPNEVAHNPDFGTQLTYFIGATRYRPDEQDGLDAGRFAADVNFGARETKRLVWYSAVMDGGDDLRQRVAWALNQIFVVGESGSNNLQQSERWLSYYDIFVRHAFGNFRDILGEVTFHPNMGYYLSYVNNRKADPVAGTFPDENYAREVMQLFTIGLWELNLDGTPILDAEGNLISTYTIEDIEEFAKIFTGMRRQSNRTNIEISGGNYIDPMRIQTSWHDFSAKVLLDGSILQPDGTDEEAAKAEIHDFLDHLFNHSSTPPFIARKLIQRFTLSNPSPRYIRDVGQAFIDGTYNGKGTGDRGDMIAIIKAILLHPEAREPILSEDDAFGKLREPLIRLLHYARAFELTSPQTYGFYPFKDLDDEILQGPFQSPTVFNYYLPDYQPNGLIFERGIFSPEFELHNDVTALRLVNGIRTLIYQGIVQPIGTQRVNSQGNLDLSYEIALAADTDALLDHIDLMLTGGRLTSANRESLKTLLESMPAENASDLQARVERVLSIFSLLPEFNILY